MLIFFTFFFCVAYSYYLISDYYLSVDKHGQWIVYYKLKHWVLYHQHIAGTVFFLHFRKPDWKDAVGGLLFLIIEFLGLTVLWEHWTEPDRIYNVFWVFLVVTWYKSGPHFPALGNYLGLKSLTVGNAPSPRLGIKYLDIVNKPKRSQCGLCWVDIASSCWYKWGVMLFWWKLQHTCMISVTSYWDWMLFRHNFLTANICIGCKIESITIN